MIWILLGLAATLVVWFVLRPSKCNLDHLPGPKGIPFMGNSLQINRLRPRLTFLEWSKKYGPVVKVQIPFLGTMVLFSGYEVLSDVLVARGKRFGHRPQTFRLCHMQENTGFNLGANDPKWKAMHQLNSRVLRTVGEGRSNLEIIINDAAKQMCDKFMEHVGIPYDPEKQLRTTSLSSISILVIGEKLADNDPLIKSLGHMAEEFISIASDQTLAYLVLDYCPALIHLPLESSKRLKSFRKLQMNIWKEIYSRQGRIQEGLVKSALDMGRNENDESELSHTDIRVMVATIFVGGILTTSRVFYNFLNVLAHRPDVQKKVQEEVPVVSGNSKVEVHQRAETPYIQATFLETLRCFTPATQGGLPHVNAEDEVLPGYGKIPKGTHLMINQWALHHDETFWKDPATFRPERFLDSDGNVVSADHPNRRHLMPFGAGTRRCWGEHFAMARLFIWAVIFLQQFTVSPAEGNDPDWMDPNTHCETLGLKTTPYKIILNRRV